ncbi:MAG TPA: hypothetical protein VK918_07680, partial [Pyrinomonadaceae bacterium]|nr:hypothetical protein [Pyrinomonadaceae bacterium]
MGNDGRFKRRALGAVTAVLMVAAIASAQVSTTEFRDGRWFNGSGFVTKRLYSVEGRLTEKRPKVIDRSIDLEGLWMISPLAEAHNHNIATGVVEWDRRAVANYLSDGVFYVKIQGNLPITSDELRKLGVNDGLGVDAQFAQGTIT